MKKKTKAIGARRTAAGEGRGERKAKREQTRFIDLFAGIGGFRVALSWPF